MPLSEWQDFERRYVNGVEELPIEALLTANGIKVSANTKETADNQVPWGMRCTETPAGLKVKRVQRASAAARAGISAHDVIVAIDGIKADLKQLTLWSDGNHEIICHVFRRDELIVVTVNTGSIEGKSNAVAKNGVFPHKVSLTLSTPSSSAQDESTMPGQAWLDVVLG